MPDNGFTRCDACAGMGFHRRGAFAGGTFHACGACGGTGRAYLNPAPPPDKPRPEADPVIY